MVDPMASNVVAGLKFTDSGGEITDFRLMGGYFSGVSDTSGYGIYAQDLHSSQLEGYSAKSFSYGTYLTAGTVDNQFFGGRMENSGPQPGHGTTSYVCSGSGVKSTFWGAYDPDTGSTSTLQNLNSASCTQHS